MISRKVFIRFVCAADMVSRFIFTEFASLPGLDNELPPLWDRMDCFSATGLPLFSSLTLNQSKGWAIRLCKTNRLGRSNDATHITGPAKTGGR
jgi:hypothetical protein